MEEERRRCREKKKDSYYVSRVYGRIEVSGNVMIGSHISERDKWEEDQLFKKGFCNI